MMQVRSGTISQLRLSPMARVERRLYGSGPFGITLSRTTTPTEPTLRLWQRIRSFSTSTTAHQAVRRHAATWTHSSPTARAWGTRSASYAAQLGRTRPLTKVGCFVAAA
jgi:hypothetical protein